MKLPSLAVILAGFAVAPLPLYSSLAGFVFVKGDWWHIHAHFGPADDFISIQFNSSQAGIVRKADGKFIFLGQD